MSWMFFLFGLASLTGQILLLRELLVIFYGTEISVGIFFGSWLAGIGIGASFGAWLAKTTTRAPHGIFVHSLVALGFSVIFQICLVRFVPLIFGISPAELTPLHGILATAPAATFTASFLTGFLFPVGCKCLEQAEGRAIGRLYAVEGLGGLIGGIAFTFLLVRYLPPVRIAAVVSIAIALGATAYALRRKVKSGLISSVPLLFTGITLLSPAGDRFLSWTIAVRWESLHPGLTLLESQPTPYHQVEIGSLGTQRSLFGNGKIVASFPDPHTADRTAALVLAQTPQAKRLLLIGGGIGSLVGSFLKYPLDRLEIVEPDPWVLPIAERYLPQEEMEALRDGRVHIIFSDGRFFVNRLPHDTYDAIVCLVPDPVSAFWNRYFTREFFLAASRALKPRGVFVTRVTSAENFWGAEVASYAGSVYHTMKEIFPEVKGTPGDETVFVASKSAQVVSLDSEVLKARYGALSKPPFDPAGFDTLVPPHRTAFVAKELERSPRLINTDFDPISSSLAMILWGKFSGTAHLEVLNTLRRGGMKAYLIPLALFVVARICFRARWGPRDGQEARFQALLAMAAAGTAAMGLQIVLIYAYQSLFGYIFERIGLIAAFFMAGLVLGGFFGGELVFRVRNKAVLTALVLAAFSLLCLVTSPGLKLAGTLEPWLIELVVFAMVVVSGILTGAAFPVAASRHLEIGGNAGETSGWTDAADHFGAAIGAIITGTLLVPLLGMTHACLLLAVVVAVPAILIGSEFVFHRIDPILERLRPHPRPSFPYIRLSWLLAFCVTAAFLWGLLIGPPGSSPLVQFPEEMLKKVSGSEAFQFKEDPFPHYVGTSPGEAGFTVSLSTMPTSRTVRGYGGPINVLLSVSDRGIIKGLSVVESRETPSYIKGMDKWLEGFRGRSVLKPLQGEIDAMTGATISSRAIIEAVQGTGKKIAEPLLGLREVETAAAPKPRGRDLLTDARLWSVVLLMILFTYAFYSRSRRIRLGCLFASLLVLGIYLNAPFTCLEAAGIIRGEIPASGTIWRNALFVGVVLISVFWGQAFCGFLCPFGAVQEFLSVKKLRLRPTAAVERAGRYCKFVLLGVLLCLFLVTDDTIWFSFDPLQHFFADHTRDFFLGRMDTWILGLCLAGLLASIFYFRFWCRYLCPAGAFLALANKIALLRKYAPTPIPGRCDLGVASTHDVDCIQCHRCLEK